jgi:hypothetical protein
MLKIVYRKVEFGHSPNNVCVCVCVWGAHQYVMRWGQLTYDWTDFEKNHDFEQDIITQTQHLSRCLKRGK